jgi:hypothetical protein
VRARARRGGGDQDDRRRNAHDQPPDHVPAP